jgi:hypothetical protein
MRLGRIGGVAVLLGWGLLAAGVALSNIAGSTVGGAVMRASFAMIGCGAASLAISGPPPLHGRGVRIGLGMLAVGLVSVALSSVAAARLTYDPLEDLPTVVLLLGGGLATFLGVFVTEVALLFVRGDARLVGSLFFLGLGLVLLMAALGDGAAGDGPLQLAGRVIGLVGAVTLAIWCVGPGVLAVRGDRRIGAAVT